ncbi:MAG: hypothetical protein HS132_12650 [Planctomycetia bacterium]|nr:hypothetical protein [Planctomycetia bacterium]
MNKKSELSFLQKQESSLLLLFWISTCMGTQYFIALNNIHFIWYSPISIIACGQILHQKKQGYTCRNNYGFMPVQKKGETKPHSEKTQEKENKRQYLSL